MTTLLASALLALVLVVVVRDVLANQRVAQIERERKAERAAAREERRELYQRIQAPELAVDEHVREQRGPRRRVRPIAADDDAAFKAQREDRG